MQLLVELVNNISTYALLLITKTNQTLAND